MAYNAGVSFFVPFHGLAPSNQNKCIFFTQRCATCPRTRVCQRADHKRARCPWKCQEDGHSRAVALWEAINAIPPGEVVGLDLLEEYALSNCCKKARHRERMEDIGLLGPLAERWQDEIQRRAEQTTPARSPGSPGYDLRPRESSLSLSSSTRTPTRSPSSSPPVLSEFRPHVAKPLPSDRVAWKLREPLVKRDFETGSVYIFDRDSSPGHVKIGWTARSVLGRLEDWAKCGYTPNLLMSVDDVPNAQRVETLTHHELITEWRRERQCKAPWCRKSHQEWFEVSKERAKQVLGDWADFMIMAEPYDSKGQLMSPWRQYVDIIDGRHEVVTARKLFELYENSLFDESTLVVETLELGNVAKIEEASVERRSELGRHQILEEDAAAAAQTDSPRIEKPTPKIEPTCQTQARSEPQPQATHQQQRDETCSAQQPTFVDTEPPVKAEVYLAGKALSKTEPPSSQVISLPNSEPGAKEGSTIPTTTVKIEPPAELTLLPPVPPTTSRRAQETKPDSRDDSKTNSPASLSPSAPASSPAATSITKPKQNIPERLERKPIGHDEQTFDKKLVSQEQDEKTVETKKAVGGDEQAADEKIKTTYDQKKPTGTEAESDDLDGKTATKTEVESPLETKTESGSDHWDVDETLLEDQTQTTKSIAMALSKIVDEHSIATATVTLGKQATGGLTGLEGPKTLQSEAPPVVEALALA